MLSLSGLSSKQCSSCGLPSLSAFGKEYTYVKDKYIEILCRYYDHHPDVKVVTGFLMNDIAACRIHGEMNGNFTSESSDFHEKWLSFIFKLMRSFWVAGYAVCGYDEHYSPFVVDPMYVKCIISRHNQSIYCFDKRSVSKCGKSHCIKCPLAAQHLSLCSDCSSAALSDIQCDTGQCGNNGGIGYFGSCVCQHKHLHPSQYMTLIHSFPSPIDGLPTSKMSSIYEKLTSNSLLNQFVSSQIMWAKQPIIGFEHIHKNEQESESNTELLGTSFQSALPVDDDELKDKDDDETARDKGEEGKLFTGSEFENRSPVVVLSHKDKKIVQLRADKPCISEYLRFNQSQKEDICSVFGIPPHLIHLNNKQRVARNIEDDILFKMTRFNLRNTISTQCTLLFQWIYETNAVNIVLNEQTSFSLEQAKELYESGILKKGYYVDMIAEEYNIDRKYFIK